MPVKKKRVATKKATPAPEPALKFPNLVHKRLLEIVMQANNLENEKNTILATFFSTLGIENIAEYKIDLEANTLTKRPPAEETTPQN